MSNPLAVHRLVGPAAMTLQLAAGAATLGRSIGGLVWADGGQGRARRNAWSAVVSDARARRERAAVELALAAVSPPVAAPGSVPLAAGQ